MSNDLKTPSVELKNISPSFNDGGSDETDFTPNPTDDGRAVMLSKLSLLTFGAGMFPSTPSVASS